MLVETAAEHLAELRPGKERGRRRVGGDEALAVLLDERHQVGALLWCQVDLADTEEEDRVEVVEVPREELLAERDACPRPETILLFVIGCESVRMNVSYAPDSCPSRSIVASAWEMTSC